MFKERMTPEELASMTGFSRQTINKWVRKERWSTSPRPGVQGGKARLIHIDERVRDFIHSSQRIAEPRMGYTVTAETSLDNLLITSLKEMAPEEQKQFSSLLLREGVAGMLRRLGIRDSSQAI
ncbi:YfeC-like transcriptional regulator [Shimwellia blattae]|uniref:Putative DNA-binding transcriptional regulator n=1 Tax=Shimwellia blattae (strain ATCC 29907 / DSM 4481 / JCM 1650 / NBRC 105725 / CDC 9005-74) TaxID=630626 RepID=I2B6R9_SHIBC|nr:YfeC-like transcriptional regulator [Shimwellia blattae]AFJ46223.1 putative DNA-binding transcriptional regulator [Shimwellia blattae DSM 4481 = NBRC 105725]